MSTPAEIEADVMCWQLAHYVAGIAPPGIGAWPRAWEIVEQPSRQFLALLPTLGDGGELARKRLDKAGNAVAAAWKQAAQEYREARAS